jgi:hypothetical protein
MRVLRDNRRAQGHGNKKFLYFKFWGTNQLKFSRNLPELDQVVSNYEHIY